MFDLIAAVAHLQPMVVMCHRYRCIDAIDLHGLPRFEACPLALVRPGELRRWTPPPRPGRVDLHDTICPECRNSHRACHCANLLDRIRALGDAIGCLADFVRRVRAAEYPLPITGGRHVFILPRRLRGEIDELMQTCPLAWTSDQERRAWRWRPI